MDAFGITILEQQNGSEIKLHTPINAKCIRIYAVRQIGENFSIGNLCILHPPFILLQAHPPYVWIQCPHATFASMLRIVYCVPWYKTLTIQSTNHEMYVIIYDSMHGCNA